MASVKLSLGGACPKQTEKIPQQRNPMNHAHTLPTRFDVTRCRPDSMGQRVPAPSVLVKQMCRLTIRPPARCDKPAARERPCRPRSRRRNGRATFFPPPASAPLAARSTKPRKELPGRQDFDPEWFLQHEQVFIFGDDRPRAARQSARQNRVVVRI